MTSHPPLVIQQASVILPDGDLWIGDVLIEDAKITQLATQIAPREGSSIIDARGLTLLPG